MVRLPKNNAVICNKNHTEPVFRKNKLKFLQASFDAPADILSSVIFLE